MSKIIPYGRQDITESDLAAVAEILKADYLTQGPKIAEFERNFSQYVGSKFAIAVSNGTAALHLSVMALGLNDGEYVICTPITFVASINCVKYCGGNVLFADIDPETYLIDPKSVKQVIADNSDKVIRGIIPVDFAGRMPQLDELRVIANEYDLWIIEDACHAPGGYFMDSNGKKQLAGNGQIANASTFSFHPVKHIATGEGGMITTNDRLVYDRLMELRTHGITKNMHHYQNSVALANGSNETESNDYPKWYMEMHELGYNYRITDIQAALGVSQLSRAAKSLEKRRSIAEKYTKAFEGAKGILGSSGYIDGHAYHLYVLEVEDRRALYDNLRKLGIFTQIHYIPAHLMPYYQEQGWKQGDLPNAEKYYSRCISIPMYPTLSEEDQDFVITSILNFYK